ncbi:MAG TPA: transcription termination/antitermination NusG family protein [Pseudaminobacter sp.]|nr:transcription termination/antitermination NusG family protein [Pseudaminobacter sp.]
MNIHAPKPCWFVVQTDAMAEIKAARELKLGGYEVYCPVWRKEYRHPRTKKWTTKDFALFPRYLFVRLVSPDLGGLVATFDGVRGLLRSQGFALPIADDDVATIKRTVESGALDEMRDHNVRLRPGKVNIEGGQFLGLSGLLESIKDGRKARVLVDLLGRSVPTEVDITNLVQATTVTLQ